MSDPIDQLSDGQIERYARHLVLPEMGAAGQVALGQARVAIIGCGGLGSHTALALANAGVGYLELWDPDVVDLSNLPRQPFTTAQIGQPKPEALGALIAERNPETDVALFPEAFAGSTASLWLDCTDSYSSRKTVSALQPNGTNLVFGSVLGMDAQVTVFEQADGFSALFPEAPTQRQTCADQGVLAPLVGLTAQLMATEALSLLTGRPSDLTRNLLLIDARDWRFTKLAR